MKYVPLRQNWYYSPVNIPNLAEIQKEMLFYYNRKYEYSKAFNPKYINIFKRTMNEQDYPATAEYLKSVGLYDKFYRILLSQNQSNAPDDNVKTEETTTGPAVHVDTVDPYECQFSLNIPLQNCNNSYIGFFKTSTPEMLKPAFLENDKRHGSNFAWMPAQYAEEITRAEMIQPILVNTTILHRGISDNADRAICCFRFKPELTDDDIARLGIIIPLT